MAVARTAPSEHVDRIERGWHQIAEHALPADACDATIAFARLTYFAGALEATDISLSELDAALKSHEPLQQLDALVLKLAGLGAGIVTRLDPPRRARPCD